MLLFERLISLYAPLVCLGCSKEADALLCPSCRAHVPTVPTRCYRCRAVTRDYVVCDGCRRHTSLRRVLVAMHYDGLAKELVHRAKYERARAGIAEMAELMTPLLPLLPDKIIFVPVPTATSRVRQRGYDQAVALAQLLARSSGSGVVQALSRLGQAHQVGAGRKERLEHLEHAFRLVRPQRIRGAHCILVDDVLTTGATLETAARVLKRAGARRVDAIVFAQAGQY